MIVRLRWRGRGRGRLAPTEILRFDYEMATDADKSRRDVLLPRIFSTLDKSHRSSVGSVIDSGTRARVPCRDSPEIFTHYLLPFFIYL